MNKPTLRQLQIFEAIARHRSFTRAAEELFLTQSSVSSQMKQLTEHLDQSLIEMSGKKVHLTSTGERVLRLYSEMECSWESFVDDMSQLAAPDSGAIEVTCANTCQYFFPRVLGNFSRRYPKIKISLKIFNHRQLKDHLLKNAGDLFIMDYVPEELDVKAIPFLDNPLVIIADPSHPLVARNNISLEHLKNEMFVVRELRSGTRRETDKFFESYGINIQSKIELGSNEAIIQGVMDGLGIGVVSAYAAAQELRLGILKSLDVYGFPIMRKWNICYPNHRVVRPVVRTFLDFLQSDGRLIAGLTLDNVELLPPLLNQKKNATSA